MSRLKLHALAGVCALAIAPALAGGAHAESYIYGGGSSLLAPYWTEGVACWSTDASIGQTTHGLYTKPASPTAPAATFATVTAPTVAPTACAPAAQTYSINFDSTGSGTGQVGVFAHDAIIGTNLTATGGVTSTTSIDFGSATSAGNTELFPSIQYGLSDNSLVNADVGVYQVGTNASYTPPDGSGTFTTATSYQAMTFDSTGTAHNGGTNSTDYPIPSKRYGPLVQFPVSIDPVALAYNPIYKTVGTTNYSLKVKTALKNADGSGGLRLDQSAYCKIYTGAITDWGDAALTALNGGQSLKDPADTGAAPITIVGRTDSSGTTSIFTRNLAAVCGDPAVFGTKGTTTLPTAITSLANFVGGSGSSGVATAINGHKGAIGYIGPDYALPAVTKTMTNTYGLNVSDVKNATTGAFVEPTGASALAAFGTLAPPSTDALRKDPTQWVQGTSDTVTLANPTAGYPIVGTTNFIGYSCYASSNSVTALQKFLAFGGGAQAKEILLAAGLSQLPGSSSTNDWLDAISNYFVFPNATTAADNLFFAAAGTGSDGNGHTNTNCKVSGVVGG